MKKHKIFWWLAGALVVLVSFSYGLAAGTYQLPPYAVLQRFKKAIINRPAGSTETVSPVPPVGLDQPLPESTLDKSADVNVGLQAILQLIADQDFQTQTETIDFVRNFVYTNSVHLLDEEFWEYAYDTPRVLEMLYDAYANDAPQPHLVCDPRSYAMAEILGNLSIRRRVVYVYTDNLGEEVQSHTFLEVFNEDFDRWEVQDPDYNVYWENTLTGERVSALQLVLDDLETLMPRSFSADAEAFALEHLKPYYFEVLVYPGGSGVVNIERFNIEDPFLDTLADSRLMYVQGFSNP